jgi:hypothetical protein
MVCSGTAFLCLLSRNILYLKRHYNKWLYESLWQWLIHYITTMSGTGFDQQPRVLKVSWFLKRWPEIHKVTYINKLYFISFQFHSCWQYFFQTFYLVRPVEWSDKRKLKIMNANEGLDINKHTALQIMRREFWHITVMNYFYAYSKLHRCHNQKAQKYVHFSNL